MKQRRLRFSTGQLQAVAVSAAGAIWGLGLARFLGEASPWKPLYGSPLAVASVAIACAVLTSLIDVWLGPSSPSPFLPLSLSLLYVTGIIPRPLAGGALLIGGIALTSSTIWEDRRGWLLPASLGVTTLGLYLRTLLPSLGEADTLEFQVIASQLGVAHPTGYPLYILLSKLFTLLPLHDVAWRVNLASAVFATGAVLTLYTLARRLTDRPLISLLAALALAFSPTFWSQAIIAEVYALHNFLVAAILWLLFHAAFPRRWWATLFLLGLSLTNHLTTALLTPAVALALFWDGSRPRIRDWLIGGGFFLLGLSVYLLIPLRWPALNEGELMTLRDFATYVTGGQFHGALRLDGWRDPTRWRIVWRLLREPFGWAGLGLATAGVVDLAARRWRTLALTGVTFLAFLLYGLDYYVADISVFLLPAHLILAIWIAVGAASLAGLASGVSSSVIDRESFDVYHLLVALFALLPLSQIWLNLPAVDESRNHGRYAWGRYVLSLPLAEEAAILADTEAFAPLYYLQQVEGVRSDLDIVLLGTERLYQAELRRRLRYDQTVYLARYLPHLEEFFLRSVGPLVEVRNPVSGGNRVSRGAVEPRARFGEVIQLLDTKLIADPFGRALYHLTLRWQAEAPVPGDFVVELRLVDTQGRPAWMGEGRRPVDGLYPTNAWPVDQVIPDYHEIAIPPWLPPGRYELEVALSPPFSEGGLAVDGGPGTWLTLRALEVEPPSDPEPLSHWERVSFSGGPWLTGYDLAGEADAGAPFAVDLAWRRLGQERRLRLAWEDVQGRRAGEAAFSISSGLVRSRHVITAPEEVGVYALRASLVGEPARCGWLASAKEACTLATVEVASGREGVANFGGRALLLDAEVSKRKAEAGEIIPVTLRWRPLRAMDEDYTVFVHLVGPDGRLHGQVDAWPMQGSYPTSQWKPGEEVIDRYQVRLRPDAPPGRYRVQVGLYLLETMGRLRVLNARGKPIADAFTAGEFNVQQ